MSMNFKALRAFTLVMEFGSITAAADKLNLSPPAVSRLVAQLEFETKLKLFDRTHRGLSPTEAGHLFMKEAQRILTDLEELPDVIRRIKRSTLHRLSILTTPRLLPGLVVPALARMAACCPDVKCALDVQPKWELERSLTRNRYDVCAAILPVPNNALTVQPLYRIAAEVMMPATHALASRPHVTAGDLAQERLIGFLPGQLLRRQISDLFRNAGIEMEFSMEISTSIIAADLTRMGCGVSVVDRLLSTGVNTDELVSVPFEPRVWTTAGVLFTKDEEASPPTLQFVACMRDIVEEFARRPGHRKIIEIFPALKSSSKQGAKLSALKRERSGTTRRRPVSSKVRVTR